MGQLATWDGDIPYELHVVGEYGAGRQWYCTCRKGYPKSQGYPCGHIRDAWEKAKQGRLSNSWRWTPEGLDLAANCRCIGEAPRSLEIMPPKVHPPTPEGPSRNKPCPCGSVRADGNPLLYKFCHALPPDQRPPEARPWGEEAPRFIGTGRGLPADVEREVKRGKRRVEKAEKQKVRDHFIDAILDRIHDPAQRRALAREQGKRERERARAKATPMKSAKAKTAKRAKKASR